MTQIVSGLILGFIITILLLPVLIHTAEEKNIFVARRFRDVHKTKVSALGGIAIFSSVFFVMLFFSEFESVRAIRYYIAAGFFIFLIGLRDDIKNVKPLGKLAGQIIAGLILIFPGGIRLEHFTFQNQIYLFPEWFSVIATLVIIIWFINAYNFFDGIDMQASLTAIAILIPYGIWYFLTEQFNFSLLLLSTSAALIAFFIYNYSPSKIFMGDTGTVSIGFIIAFSFLKFSNLNIDSDFEDMKISYPLFFGILSFQLPLADSIRVIITRILKGKNPLHADKNHFHHLLLKAGWNQQRIAFLSGFYTLFMIALNYILILVKISTLQLVFINILILLLLYVFVYYKKKHFLSVNSNQ